MTLPIWVKLHAILQNMDEKEISNKMQRALDALKDDLSGIRTGRATSSLVENVVVLAYGGAQRLKIMELASISVPDAQQIIVEPWDKSIIGEIRKGIEAANIGLNPSIDGDKIRLSVPPMTTEDREKFVKLLSQKMENARIMVRQVRGEGMQDIKKSFEEKALSEDQRELSEKNLQKITDEFIKKIEDIGMIKEQDLRKV